jgi:hypothetical protein
MPQVMDADSSSKAKVVFAFNHEKVFRLFQATVKQLIVTIPQVFWIWIRALTMLPVPVWMHAELPPPLLSSSSSSSSAAAEAEAAEATAAASLCSRCFCVVSPAFRHMSQRGLMMSVDKEEGSAWIPSFIIFFQVRW